MSPLHNPPRNPELKTREPACANMLLAVPCISVQPHYHSCLLLLPLSKNILIKKNSGKSSGMSGVTFFFPVHKKLVFEQGCVDYFSRQYCSCCVRHSHCPTIPQKCPRPIIRHPHTICSKKNRLTTKPRQACLARITLRFRGNQPKCDKDTFGATSPITQLQISRSVFNRSESHFITSRLHFPIKKVNLSYDWVA